MHLLSSTCRRQCVLCARVVSCGGLQLGDWTCNLLHNRCRGRRHPAALQQGKLTPSFPHTYSIPASPLHQVEDVNTRFLCSELRALGWRVDKVGCRPGRGPQGQQAQLARRVGGCRRGSQLAKHPKHPTKGFPFWCRLPPLQVVVVRDDVEAICREVRALSAAHDIVFTSGGLGE